ncbi:hypothetical protein C7T94_01580 [Pedobacter yulinensis]|uniref:TraB/GumN family protein n=1 Tax=Pedobacter yulinensis TaxID=2126353 RepID=A0A2T3HR17_9SPHI|nr:TraB/GumN family protein [Pedobacter yulinensis]PST84843.1 hypothetical protein C7T94_01580 [Pedobacter yulinensis]
MRKFLLFAVLFTTLNSAFAQKTKDRTLLWEISGNGLKKPSFLFGTYHLIGKQFIDTMPALQARLAESTVIVGELLFDSLDARKMMPMMVMRDTTLEQLLGPEQYTKLGNYLKDVSGMPIAALNKMKPAALQLLIAAYSSPIKVKDGEGLDQQLQVQGNAAGKRLVGLESAGFQMNMLLGESLAKQKAALLKTMAKSEELKTQGLKLYQHYIRQETDLLGRLFADREFIDEDDLEKMLYRRNRNWVQQLPAIMQQDQAFVAVGAGHLLGDQGLIVLLRKAGYTLRPLATN